MKTTGPIVALCLLVACGDDGSSDSSSSSTGADTTASGSTSGTGGSGGTTTAGSQSSSGAGSGGTGGTGTHNGDPCSDPSDCDAGFACVPNRIGPGSVCAAECVPFDGTDDCDDGWFCLGETATTGHCVPPTDSGTGLEESCDPPLSACGEDLICQGVSNGMTICVAMCRFAMGDDDCPPMRTCIDAYDLPEVGGCAPI